MNIPPATSGPTERELAALLDSGYGLAGELTRLPGENDNYLLTTSHQRYVLKLVGNDVTRPALDLERCVVDHLQAAQLGLALPRVLPTRHGSFEARRTTHSGTVCGRLFEFVPGTAWHEAGPRSPDQFGDLGRILGAVHLSLARFSHPAAKRTHRWDLTTADQHRQRISMVGSPRQRELLEDAFHLYAAGAKPRLGALPRGIIHGDINDENVLIQGDRVSGLLDFGDCLEAPIVCDLAIALAYATLDAADPLAAAARVVAPYHALRPLSQTELDVLFPLVCGRLAVTVTVAAERRAIDPERTSWFVTEERAWRLLERLRAVPPHAAAAHLATHLDLTPALDVAAPLETLLERRRQRLGPSLSVAYEQPLQMVRGRGQYLFDRNGVPYLDLVNNVCHVGHCHPRVVEAGQRQMALLNTNTRYVFEQLTDYAERLCDTLPARLNTCFFVNSGSEANELARRLAMTHTARGDFLVVDGAYHGHTPALIGMSPYKFMGPGGAHRADVGVHVVPVPDGFRGRHKGHSRASGIAYGNEVKRVLDETGAAIAGFLVESLQSCAGQIVPPPGYLQTAFEHVRSAGGLCIADEVQVGFGRVGTHFWGFEAQGVVPDIVVMGKPIGNGHPMAAVVTTADIAASFANGMEFFATFGGNPVSCAIGVAVLDVIRDEGLQEHAHVLGRRLLHGLQEIMERHELIGDVRGAGLFIGVELVRDRGTLEPAASEAQAIVERMKERRMLLSTDGPLHNVIKIKPPMVLNTGDADMFLRAFGDVLVEIENTMP